MKIYYIKTKFGYYIEGEIEYCCRKMEIFYDLTHKREYCINMGLHSGVPRLYGRYDPDDAAYETTKIDYCPFCGEKIDIQPQARTG